MGSLTSGAFNSAIKNDALPTFTFVTPNLCDDTHDCPVAVGDAWLGELGAEARGEQGVRTGRHRRRHQLRRGRAGPERLDRTLGATRPRLASRRNHFSALRTIEEMLGLPYLGWAANRGATGARSPLTAAHIS